MDPVVEIRILPKKIILRLKVWFETHLSQEPRRIICMFAAVVLTHDSQKMLKEIAQTCLGNDANLFVFITANGMHLPHHMTLNMGDFNTSINDQSILGQTVVMRFRHFAHNLKLGVAAVAIEEAKVKSSGSEVKSTNAKMHITCCIMPGSKPFKSNDLFLDLNETKNTFLQESVVLEGVVSICK